MSCALADGSEFALEATPCSASFGQATNRLNGASDLKGESTLKWYSMSTDLGCRWYETGTVLYRFRPTSARALKAIRAAR